MGFRFQKRIKILPGVRINLSKTGVSTSVGSPGATVNFRKGRSKLTLGAPGTGMSYSIEGKKSRRTRKAADAIRPSGGGSVVVAFLGGLFKGLGLIPSLLIGLFLLSGAIRLWLT